MFHCWPFWVLTDGRFTRTLQDLCAVLEQMQTKAPSHSFALTKSTVERAFNRPMTELFETFDEAPVASGSIAQIHRATLTPEGARGMRYKYRPGTNVRAHP